MRRAQVPVLVPSIVPTMTTPRVLVMEWMEGFKVTNTVALDSCHIDRSKLLSRICEAMAQQIYLDGIFNADPHPGNILVQVTPENRVFPILLDFGLTRSVSTTVRIAFSRLVFSALHMDYAGMLQSFDEMGLKLKRESVAEDMQNLRFAFRDTSGSIESRKQFQAMFAERQAALANIPKSQRNPVESWPADLVFFMRSVFLIRGLCSILECQLPYMQILGPFAQKALIDSIPRPLHARGVISFASIGSSLENKVCAVITRLHHGQAVFGGLQVCVLQGSQNEVLVDVAAGTLSASDPRPVTGSTLFVLFSLSKAILAATLTAIMSARSIPMTARVCDYWPSFSSNGKHHVTFHHILTHSTGITSVVSPHVQGV